MKTNGNVVLITGGATGIGFALASAFARTGNEVIICGRRENKLAEAKRKLPGIDTFACDVSKKKGRQELFEWVSRNHGDLNILINNAGVQHDVDFKAGPGGVLHGQDEIATNFVAPVHLSAYFIPLLIKRSSAAIINVSSGLGFVPMASMAIYCATKAGVHSFTLSLRHLLQGTSIKVFEIIPPMVDTELGRGETAEPPPGHRGIPPSDVASEVMKALDADEYEIVVGEARGLVSGSRTNFEKVFERLNSW